MLLLYFKHTNKANLQPPRSHRCRGSFFFLPFPFFFYLFLFFKGRTWGGVCTLFTNTHRGAQPPSTADIRMLSQPTLNAAAVRLWHAAQQRAQPLLPEEARRARIMAAPAANSPRGSSPRSPLHTRSSLAPSNPGWARTFHRTARTETDSTHPAETTAGRPAPRITGTSFQHLGTVNWPFPVYLLFFLLINPSCI